MSDPTHLPAERRDFFISYRGLCRAWALWVDWVVRHAGFSTILMEDFPSGTAWTAQMREAADRCDRLIPLYSAEYWQSGACTAEFDAYWHQHMKDEHYRFLLPLWVEECTVPVIHQPLLGKKLHSLTRDAAQADVLQMLAKLSPLSLAGPFTEREPPFPGARTSSTILGEWPEQEPTGLRWPLADHSEARLAFARLITRGSPHRLLMIQGESDTGKSTLTEQIHINANRILGLRCGRFDFKGGTDIEVGLVHFAGDLKVVLPPAGGGLSSRLAAILECLLATTQPAILVFDTYNDAGEVSRWFEDFLLRDLHRLPHLRVIIAGKTVPTAHAKYWAPEAAPTVYLSPPTADDWFTYGVEYRPGLTRSDVEVLYKHAVGKPTLLAALLGPAA